MQQEYTGGQTQQNVFEKAVSRMMGGSTQEGDESPQIVIGEEYGLTPYSGEAVKAYETMRDKRRTLDTSEYYAVTQGYLREWVCMGPSTFKFCRIPCSGNPWRLIAMMCASLILPR
jgi:hypothetical protein